jgi:nitrogen fixation/metabolism regulation signal transduction histidine kinase
MVLLLLCMSISSVMIYVFYESELYFCLFFACVWVLILIAYVVASYSENTRRLGRMIESIRHGDFSLSYSINRHSRMEKRLVEDINEVMTDLRSKISAQEERYRYYETLLDTVDTCMLVTDKEGKVMWMNQSAVKELCGYAIHQLDELKGLNSDFPVILAALQPGEVKVVRIYKEELMQDMAVTVTEYSTNYADLRLINLKNIRSILEENEMEAWQKLVRVLTHEIMNSITPIISLSDTLCDRAIQQGMDEESLMLQGL